ncbi:MAG TPA: hypothetical protein VFO41_08930 [Alphaproteobacteria bacterium]|nr:hypothetical protein [Alphaproteobacteria bacterium]
MRLIPILWLIASSAAFIAAASAAKWHVLTARPAPLLAALALYTLGNLIIIHLMREVGLGLAISLSAVVQLIVVNVVAVMIFHEPLGTLQSVGLCLGIVGVALMLFGAQGSSS